jgi:hypothetical protein
MASNVKQNALLSTPEFTLESKLPPPSSIRAPQSGRKLDMSDIDNSFGRQATPTEEMDGMEVFNNTTSSHINKFKGISPLMPSMLSYDKTKSPFAVLGLSKVDNNSVVGSDLEKEVKLMEENKNKGLIIEDDKPYHQNNEEFECMFEATSNTHYINQELCKKFIVKLAEAKEENMLLR